jgi:hypothetical protein
MKSLISALVLMASVSTTAFAQAAPATKEVTIALSEVYVPGGFSPATDAYVIVSGMFPNSCYRWARAEVNNTGPLTHEVKSIATVSQTMCLMVLVPYTKEVNLGRLQTGDHTLRFVNGDGTYFEKTLKVE